LFPCKLSLIEIYRRRAGGRRYFEILGLSENDEFVLHLYKLLGAKNHVQYCRRAVERAQAGLKKHGKDDATTDHVTVHLHPFDSRDECVKSKRYATPVVVARRPWTQQPSLLRWMRPARVGVCTALLAPAQRHLAGPSTTRGWRCCAATVRGP